VWVESFDFGLAHAVEDFFFDATYTANAVGDYAKQKDDKADDEGSTAYR
jgi:hypothetical protein